MLLKIIKNSISLFVLILFVFLIGCDNTTDDTGNTVTPTTPTNYSGSPVEGVWLVTEKYLYNYGISEYSTINYPETINSGYLALYYHIDSSTVTYIFEYHNTGSTFYTDGIYYCSTDIDTYTYENNIITITNRLNDVETGTLTVATDTARIDWDHYNPGEYTEFSRADDSIYTGAVDDCSNTGFKK